MAVNLSSPEAIIHECMLVSLPPTLLSAVVIPPIVCFLLHTQSDGRLPSAPNGAIKDVSIVV